MTTLNQAQTIALLVVQSIGGFISSFASVTLIVSIFRSNQKLSSVYRRLVCSLSVFDILVSVAQILSSLPMPAGTTWGAIGNDVTCGIQGFLTNAGFCGTLLYSLSLTVYFLLVVKFDMSEIKIKKRVEPFLHAVPIVYSLAISAYVYATNNYNPAGTFCWIAPEPINCEHDPDIECLNSGISNTLKHIGSGGPLLVAFVGNCTMLAVIWCTYHSQTKRNQTYGQSLVQAPRNTPQAIQGEDDDEEAQAEAVKSCCPFCPTKLCPISISSSSNSQSNSTSRTSVLADYLSRPSRASVRRLEDIFKRTAAYVTAFLLTFIFSTIYRFLLIKNSGHVPFIIVLLARLFLPLQGLFNVLVYTYPHVLSYRRNHKDCNWFQAFWKVIRAGGDSDQSRSGRANRRNSIRKRERVLAQSEFRRSSNFEGPMSPRSLDVRRNSNDIENLKSNLFATRFDE